MGIHAHISFFSDLSGSNTQSLLELLYQCLLAVKACNFAGIGHGYFIICKFLICRHKFSVLYVLFRRHLSKEFKNSRLLPFRNRTTQFYFFINLICSRINRNSVNFTALRVHFYQFHLTVKCLNRVHIITPLAVDFQRYFSGMLFFACIIMISA